MSVALDDPLPLLRHVFPTASGDEHGALAARLAAAARWRFCRLPLQQLGAPDDAVDASVDWGQQVVVAPSSSDRPACLVFCRPWAAPARPATLGFEASFFKLQVSTVQLMVTPLGLAAQPGYMLDVRRARDRGTGAGALHAAVPRCSDEGGEATHDLLLTLPSDQSSACLRRLSTHVGVESIYAVHDLHGMVAASRGSVSLDGELRWHMLNGSRQLSTLSATRHLEHPLAVWPCEQLEPVALRVHGGKLLALCLWHAPPGGAGSTQLQVWEVDVPPRACCTTAHSWQLLEGSRFDLPAGALLPGKLDVAPAQGCRWVVLLPCAAGACAEAAATAPAGTAQQLLVFDTRSRSWSSHEAAAGDLLMRKGLHHGVNVPVVTAPGFFSSRRRGGDAEGIAAVLAATTAAAAAAPADHVRRLQAEREPQHAARQQAVAYVVSEADGSLTAAWQEWAPLPAVRLGEIAAPFSLPYDLRAAQAARAAAAAGSGAVLLRLAADPALPPVPCPLAAARQCSQLAQLLDLFLDGGGDAAVEEAGRDCGGGGGGGGGAPPREVPLAGVAAEEHAVLQRVVACLAGQTHVGLLEGTLLLDVARLADLLDARALLAECVAVLECMAPGPELYAPLFALAEARRFHAGLQRLRVCYRHALALDILGGKQPLLGWALHGLQAGVDSILQVCTEVAATWLPLEPALWLGSPEGDLKALAAPEWRAELAQHPQRLRQLLRATLEHAQRRLEAAQQLQLGSSSSGGVRKKVRAAPSGPFQPAAAPPPRPNPAAQRSLPATELAAELQRTLAQLARVLPAAAATQRQQRTAAAFADVEARARRQQRR